MKRAFTFCTQSPESQNNTRYKHKRRTNSLWPGTEGSAGRIGRAGGEGIQRGLCSFYCLSLGLSLQGSTLNPTVGSRPTGSLTASGPPCRAAGGTSWDGSPAQAPPLPPALAAVPRGFGQSLARGKGWCPQQHGCSLSYVPGEAGSGLSKDNPSQGRGGTLSCNLEEPEARAVAQGKEPCMQAPRMYDQIYLLTHERHLQRFPEILVSGWDHCAKVQGKRH